MMGRQEETERSETDDDTRKSPINEVGVVRENITRRGEQSEARGVDVP